MATQLFSSRRALKIVRKARVRSVGTRQGVRGNRIAKITLSKRATGWLTSEEFYVAGLLLVLFVLLLFPALSMIAYLIAVPDAFQY